MNLFTGFWLGAYYFLIVGTLVGALIFSIGYGLTSKWWENVQGRNVFFYGLVITLMFILLSLRVIFGDFSGRAVVSFLLLLALFLVVWWRTILWLVGVVNRRKEKRKKN